VNASAVRAVLARHRLLARRDLGQNFLIDDAMAVRLVELAGVEPGETVIEIGAGLGTLTQALAARAGRVVAIEIDAGLVRALRAERLLPENVELLHADALTVDLAGLAGGPTRLVASLPYSVASRRCCADSSTCAAS
jgi:16S rRNA (adenine1518-N6/adenine1519-N6)-dimethyltransferase